MNKKVIAVFGILIVLTGGGLGVVKYQGYKEERLDNLQNAINSARHTGTTYRNPEFRDHPKVKQALNNHEKYKEIDKIAIERNLDRMASGDFSIEQAKERMHRAMREQREELKGEGW
ncbi:MAG: hypothetical protein ACQEUN_16315 [Pseudomonadota bacterium]